MDGAKERRSERATERQRRSDGSTDGQSDGVTRDGAISLYIKIEKRKKKKE